MGDRLPGWTAAAWRPAVVVAVTTLAYSNSFGGVFLLDDQHAVRDNPLVRDPWSHLSARSVLSPRVVAYATFAANYAVGGLNLWGLHLVNLVVHVLAALTLFGLTRRTLLLDSLRGRYAPARAADLALIAALAWAVHPLTTQAVTYIVQRMESLCGLFYLGVLYAVVRGATAATGPGRLLWYAAAVASCGLSMGSKEVGVTAPVVALLYDRCLVAGSFRAALARRWGLYLGLFAVTGVLAAAHLGLFFSPAPPPGQTPSAGFGMVEMTPWAYARTQPGVVLHYLRLAAVPYPQCFDDGWPTADTAAEIAPPAALVLALLLAVGWAVWRRPGVGFLGAAFFLVLAPTSTVLPIRDVSFEHRMYLPLAALAVLAVVAGDAVVRAGGTPAAARWGAVVAGAAVAVLAAMTYSRNEVYRSEEAMLRDVIAQRPGNARAFSRLGFLLTENEADPREALPYFEAALRLKPENRDHMRNLANCLRSMNREEEAVPLYRAAVADFSGDYQSKFGLASSLKRLGRADEAVPILEDCLQVMPTNPLVLASLGDGLRRLGRHDEAVAVYRRLAAERAGDPEAHTELGVTLLLAGGRAGEAVEVFREAVRLAPDRDKYRHFLGVALEDAGRTDAADAETLAAARLGPAWPREAAGLAWSLATHPNPGLRDGPLALLLARQVVRGTGDGDAGAQDILAAALAAVGRYEEAAAAAGRAVALANVTPGYPPAFIDQFRQRQALYRQKTPYVRPPDPRR